MKDSLKRTLKDMMTSELLEEFRRFGAEGGHKGGAAGGRARAERLSPAQLRAIAKKAAAARWKGHKPKRKKPR